jgi:hypothetical protein
MPIETPTNLDNLIMFVRLRTGDTNSSSYRYLDSWIRTALIAAVEKLNKWMNNKYLLDNDYNIYRNPNSQDFSFDEATYGIIEPGDKDVIVLMATIILLEGSLENSAWNFHSWRDAEISYSNLEQSRTRNEVLSKLWTELLNTLKPPVKRLAHSRKGEQIVI